MLLIINFFSGDSCPTIQGIPIFGVATKVGVSCKFPFSVFNPGGGILGPYDACNDQWDILGTMGGAYTGQLLCATAVDGDGNGIEFGHCDPDCMSSK